MAELAILDVGHGSCAVLADTFGHVVVDTGPGRALLNYLEEASVSEIGDVLISHSDTDHIAGLLTLLLQSNIRVQRVFLNADPRQDSAIWKDLLAALGYARRRGDTTLYTALTTAYSPLIDTGSMRLEILAPIPEVAATGVGGRDSAGRALDGNSMSVVIRVVHSEQPVVLMAGDIGVLGLEHLLAEHGDIRARVLLFAHHGGRPGRGGVEEFARRLCEAVQPEVVLFSIGRGMHGTPRPEIIRGIRHATPEAYIACTQLSERCATVVPPTDPSHLVARFARGRVHRACCAGTIVLGLNEGDVDFRPALAQHRGFVERHAPLALCDGRNRELIEQ